MLQAPEAGDAVVDAAYARLRTAWQEHGELSLKRRRAAFQALRAALSAHAQEFAGALDADFRGRSRHESLLTEVAVLLSAIDYATPRLARWSKPQRLALEWPHWLARARLVKRARGVAGIIGPGNYPLQLAVMPLIGALSAGCRALIKPSEAAPRTAALLRSMIAGALAPEVAAVVCGGAETAAAVAALPLDILLFTGSHRTGRKVAAAAAVNLTPTILELGGKSPVLIDQDTDLTRAARSIISGKLINAGQTCVAPDYLLVPAARLEPLLTALQAAAAALYPDPAGGDFTAIGSDAEFSRLSALERGQRTLRLFAARLKAPLFEPKLLIEPALDSAVMQHEIFGPLLPVLSYRTLDEAIRIINGLPPALVLYWFGGSAQRLQTVLKHTTSAAVSLNDTVIHAGISAIPLGGIGASGWGRYHGRAGFDAFSHEQPVFSQARFSLVHLLRPPYGARADGILRRLLR